jgi:hypothetical protein
MKPPPPLRSGRQPQLNARAPHPPGLIRLMVDLHLRMPTRQGLGSGLLPRPERRGEQEDY